MSQDRTMNGQQTNVCREGVSRRDLLRMLAAACLFPGLYACRGHAVRPLRLAIHTWPGYEPLFLARSMGWIDANETAIAESRSASASLQLLARGEVDAAALTLDEVLRARAAGTELTVVLVFDISAGADRLLAKPAIRTLSDLAGKRIGVEEGALGALMLAQALRRGGLDATQVHQVALTIDRHLAAWRSGEVDALVCYEPVASQLENLGAHSLFDSRQIPEMVVDVLAVRSQIVAGGEYSAALGSLIAAHFRALEHLHVSPDDYSYRVAGHLGLEPDQVLAAYKGLLLPDPDYNRRLLAGPTPVLLHRARSISDELVRTRLLPQPDLLHRLIDGSFLPRE